MSSVRRPEMSMPVPHVPDDHFRHAAAAHDRPAGSRADVLARYPRLGLAREFVACFHTRRRGSRTAWARLVNRGFTARVAANPLDR